MGLTNVVSFASSDFDSAAPFSFVAAGDASLAARSVGFGFDEDSVFSALSFVVGSVAVSLSAGFCCLLLRRIHCNC